MDIRTSRHRLHGHDGRKQRFFCGVIRRMVADGSIESAVMVSAIVDETREQRSGQGEQPLTRHFPCLRVSARTGGFGT